MSWGRTRKREKEEEMEEGGENEGERRKREKRERERQRRGEQQKKTPLATEIISVARREESGEWRGRFWRWQEK